jgi:WD40 repeat protein
MRKRMRQLMLCCLALLCLLSGCQGGEVAEESTGVESAESDSATSDAVQSGPADQVTEQIEEAKSLVVEGLLDNDDIQKLYYGSVGTLLVQTSDTLYWYDVDSGSIQAQRPADDWLEVTYYPIEKGICAIGTLSSGVNAGGFVSSGDTLCVFYDQSLQEMETITLNDLVDGVDHIVCAAVSSDGNTIAYSTQDQIYCYDRTTGTLKLVLDVSYDLIERNNGLSNITSLVFSPSGDKLLFCGGTYSLPLTDGQYARITYGCISLDGSGFQNLSFQNFVAGSLAGAASGYLFFEESMASASGKVAVVDGSDMRQQVYSLDSVHEGEAGVFCSQEGNYYATGELGDRQVTIRIYHRETGKLACTQTIEDTNEEYFYRVPTICILDSLNLCVIKLGGFHDIPSKVVMFSL